MEPWGTPASTRYSWEGFPFRTCGKMKKKKNEKRPNTQPKIW